MRRSERKCVASPTPAPPSARAAGAFTLIELLVCLGIMATLLALLAPGLRAVRGRARKFDCQMNLRSVSFDLQMFADVDLHGHRGDDEHDPALRGGNRFWLETFQESQYRIDEFWDRSGRVVSAGVDELGVMTCSEVRGDVVLRADTPCSDGAVQPARSVSYAFNLRLHRAEREMSGRWRAEPVSLSDRILDPTMANVPLIWDIDGVVAEERDISPHYSAPPGDLAGPYGDGRVWFPGMRHQGRMQVALLSGTVICSAEPLNHDDVAWTFNPLP